MDKITQHTRTNQKRQWNLRAGIIKLHTNPDRFPRRLHASWEKGFNMINVIKNVVEVASPKLIEK